MRQLNARQRERNARGGRAKSKAFVAAAAGACGLLSHSWASGATYSYTITSGGAQSWNLGTNWTPSSNYPLAAGDVSNVNDNISSNSTLNLNTSITLGVLNIGDTNASNTFTIATGAVNGLLTFNNNATGAQINVASTSDGDTISAPMVLSDNLAVENSSITAFVMSGAIGSNSGAGDGLSFNSGTVTLSGANAFAGGTTLNNGTLLVGTNSVLSSGVISTGAVGTGMLTLNGGTLTASTAKTLENGVAIGSNGAINNITLTSAGLNNLSTVALNANGTINVGSSGATIDEVIGNGTAGTGFTVAGPGVLTLGAANTYTGTTATVSGELNLDFSQGTAPATNILNSSSALSLGGGTFNVNGNGSNAVTQSFTGGTTVNQGGTVVSSTSATHGVLVNLNTISRNEGGTLNFVPSLTSSASNGFTTKNSNANNIIGAWATVGGTDWATNNGTNIVALPSASYTSTSTTTNTLANNSASQNFSIDGTITGGNVLPGGTSFNAPATTAFNSLRFNTSTATAITGATSPLAINGTFQTATVTVATASATSSLYVGEPISGNGITGIDYITAINTATGVLSLSAATANQQGPETVNVSSSILNVASGGILLSTNATSANSLSGGLLQGTTGNNDLVINNFGGSTVATEFTINDAIDNNGSIPTGLTVAGTGYTLLANPGSNFSGPLSVVGGTVEIDAAYVVGPTYVAAGAVLTQTPTTGGTAVILTLGTLTGAGTIKYQNPSPMGTFILNEASSSTFSGIISPVSTNSSLTQFFKNGPGVLTITAAGGLSFFRPIYVNSGGVTLTGNGTVVNPLTTSARLSLTINDGATVTLDDSGTNVASRLGAINEIMTLDGGTLSLIGSSVAPTTETISTYSTLGGSNVTGLSFASGADVISAAAGTGQSTALSFGAGYTRTVGASSLFAGSGLGTPTGLGPNVATIKFATAPTVVGGAVNAASENTADGVIPGTIAENLTTTSFGIATYDSTLGLRPLNSTNEQVNALTSAQNVLAQGAIANTNGTGTIAINSLTLGNGGSITDVSGQTLAVTSGTILSTDSNGSGTSIGSGAGTLQSGNGGATELVVYTAPASSLTINDVVTTNVGFTKGGAGTLTLTANNSAAGAITGGIFTMNAGTLLANNTSVNGSALVTINGGTLITGATNALGTGVITLNGGLLLANSAISNSTINVGGGGVLGGTSTITGNVAAVTVGTSGVGGTLHPGQGNSPGILKIGGNVTLNSTSTFLVDLYPLAGAATSGAGTPGVNNDELVLTGSTKSFAGSGSTLQLITSFPTIQSGLNVTYTIVDATTAGTTISPSVFSNLTLVSGSTYAYSQSGVTANVIFNTPADTITVDLTAAVPEPSSVGLLGLGAFGLLSKRRRRT